jgi:hypothetical protein
MYNVDGKSISMVNNAQPPYIKLIICENNNEMNSLGN